MKYHRVTAHSFWWLKWCCSLYMLLMVIFLTAYVVTRNISFAIALAVITHIIEIPFREMPPQHISVRIQTDVIVHQFRKQDARINTDSFTTKHFHDIFIIRKDAAQKLEIAIYS